MKTKTTVILNLIQNLYKYSYGSRINARRAGVQYGMTMIGMTMGKSHQKTALANGLVHLTEMLIDWPDNLDDNIPQKDQDVKSENYLSVDLPGVEPGRLGLSDQSSKPAKPTPKLVYHSIWIPAFARLAEALAKRAGMTEEETGTINGNPLWSTGKYGGGLKMDGTGDNVQVSDF